MLIDNNNIKKSHKLNRVNVMNIDHMKKQAGFTLIEIAIVLVIIGLLLGGVLKGQELINTARVRALNNSVDGITAAWFSFQDRYRSFPGDYLQARAVVNLPNITVGGDGNGQVSTDAERGQVWAHLEAAGYITGGYNGAIVAATEYGCSVITCPDNGFGSGMNLSHGRLIQTAGAANAHELITGRGIPVQVIAELDRKIDDGQPTTGLMHLGDGAAGAGWLAADEALCITGTAYQLQTPSSNCTAVFRTF
jgi:prepilin-type N-terminal cleavage/methylation domain-containing protein